MPTGFYEDVRTCSVKINTTRASWRWATFPKGVYDTRVCFSVPSKEQCNDNRTCSVFIPFLKSERTFLKAKSYNTASSSRSFIVVSKLDTERHCYILVGSKGILYSIKFSIPFTYNNERVCYSFNDNISFRYASFCTSISSYRQCFVERYIKGQLINVYLEMPIRKESERNCSCNVRRIYVDDNRLCSVLFTSYDTRSCAVSVSLKNFLITCQSRLSVTDFSEYVCAYSVAYAESHRYCSIMTTLNSGNVSSRIFYILIKNEKFDERKCDYSVIQKSVLYNINIIPAPYWWSNRYCYVKYIQYFSERLCKSCEKSITTIERSLSSPCDFVVVSSSDKTITLRLVSNGFVDYIDGDYLVSAIKDADVNGERDTIDIIYSAYDSDTNQTITEFTLSAFNTNGSPVTLNENVEYNLIARSKFELDITKVADFRLIYDEQICYLPPVSIVSFDYIHKEGNGSERNIYMLVALTMTEWSESRQDTNWCDYNYEWVD